MKVLQFVKSHKLITSALVLAFVAGGGVAAMTPDEEPLVKSQSANIETTPTPEATVTVEPVIESTPVETVTPTTPEPSPTATPTSEPKSSNPYAGGQLWYVYDKREKGGKVVGNWGGAALWPQMARQAGIVVDKTPEIGATCAMGSSIYNIESISDNKMNVSGYINEVIYKELALDTNGQSLQCWIIH